VDKKVKQSIKSGSSADDIYVLTLWYYELLLFTADQEESRNAISNDDSDTEGSEVETDEVSTYEAQ
jgi:hypothetical protein